jgi:hypothetical protein
MATARQFFERYYVRELRDHLLGPHSPQLLGVSRFYLLLKPPIVVDFEPNPGEGKSSVDEKRAFFTKRGIIYVPKCKRACGQ